MRYDIAIAGPFRPLFSVFGFKPADSFVELDDQAVLFSFGTARERVPLSRIESVHERRWPFYYGLGAKLGPDKGVSYVGSTRGVLQIRFREPVAMNVWGVFRTARAECVHVSLADAPGFRRALEAKLGSSR